MPAPVPVPGHTRRREEPQAITLDRTPDRDVEVTELQHFVEIRDPPRAQVIAQVIALQLIVGEKPRGIEAVLISAVLWHQIDAHVVGVALGRHTAGFDGHFLDHGKIHRVADIPAGPRQVVDLHAVVGQLDAALPVICGLAEGLCRIEAAGTADVGACPSAQAPRSSPWRALHASRQCLKEFAPNTFCCCVFCVSTSGDAPLTVTVSSSAPTCITALMVAVKPTVRTMSSRRNV
jgi:hypothetical protein